MKGKAELEINVRNMSDEALETAMDHLYRRRRETLIAIGRNLKKGPIIAVSADLPKDCQLVTRGEIVDEIKRRKGAKA